MRRSSSTSSGRNHAAAVVAGAGRTSYDPVSTGPVRPTPANSSHAPRLSVPQLENKDSISNLRRATKSADRQTPSPRASAQQLQVPNTALEVPRASSSFVRPDPTANAQLPPNNWRRPWPSISGPSGIPALANAGVTLVNTVTASDSQGRTRKREKFLPKQGTTSRKVLHSLNCMKGSS